MKKAIKKYFKTIAEEYGKILEMQDRAVRFR